jgi:hypothetical protein
MGEFGRAGGKELELLPEGQELDWKGVQDGIDYLHLEADGGRPAVHLLRVDLSSPSLKIVVPPPVEEGAGPEQLWTGGETSGGSAPVLDTGSTGVAGHVVALWNGTPFRYRFEGGRRIMDPVGVWVSGGRKYSHQEKDWGMIRRTRSGRIEVLRAGSLPDANEISGADPAAVADPDAQTDWAVGGYLPILRAGENIGIHGERHARTAVGISRDGERFFVCVVEGEMLFRPGLTSRETARIMRRAGARDALNLDGGDSSFLLLRGENGELVRYRGARDRLPCFMGVVRVDSTVILNLDAFSLPN